MAVTSASPATSASSISRPDRPRISLATEASLMLAPSRILWSRLAEAVRSWIRLVP
jgi:hypothetical protein